MMQSESDKTHHPLKLHQIMFLQLIKLTLSINMVNILANSCPINTWSNININSFGVVFLENVSLISLFF